MKTNNCVEPDAVQEWEIEAFADGDEFPHVVAHLAHCPVCQSRVKEILVTDHELKAALYRSACPTPDELRDFHWGFLAVQKTQQIKKHLTWCSLCKDELSELSAIKVIKSSSNAETIFEIAKQAATKAGWIVAHLISSTTQLTPILRGDTRDIFLFEAGDYAISINTEFETKESFNLYGQILSSEHIHIQNAQLHIRDINQGIRLDNIAVDINGSFEIRDIQPGLYNIMIKLSDQRLVIPPIELSTS